jgi:hypothetical protein
VEKYKLEGIARKCTRDTFYTWYVDFDPCDPEIIRTHLTKPMDLTFVSRRIISRESKAVVYENAIRLKGGRQIKSIVETILFPDEFIYDAKISSSIIEDQRTYTFVETPEGTRVCMEGEFNRKGVWVNLLYRLGLFKSWYLQRNQAIMDAFCRAAEEELQKPEDSSTK